MPELYIIGKQRCMLVAVYVLLLLDRHADVCFSDIIQLMSVTRGERECKVEGCVVGGGIGFLCTSCCAYTAITAL